MENDYLQKKSHEDSLLRIDEVLLKNPNDEEALKGKSFTLAHLGRYDEAIQILDNLLKKNPNDYCLLINKGAMLRENNNKKAALSCFSEALVLYPEDEVILQHVYTIDPELERLAIDLFSNNKKKRRSAIDNLGAIKTPFSARLLVEVMMDDDDPLQIPAQEALIKIGKPAIPFLYYAYVRSVRVALVLSTDAMRKIGLDVIPYLESVKNDDNKEQISEIIDYIKNG